MLADAVMARLRHARPQGGEAYGRHGVGTVLKCANGSGTTPTRTAGAAWDSETTPEGLY